MRPGEHRRLRCAFPCSPSMPDRRQPEPLTEADRSSPRPRSPAPMSNQACGRNIAVKPGEDLPAKEANAADQYESALASLVTDPSPAAMNRVASSRNWMGSPTTRWRAPPSGRSAATPLDRRPTCSPLTNLRCFDAQIRAVRQKHPEASEMPTPGDGTGPRRASCRPSSQGGSPREAEPGIRHRANRKAWSRVRPPLPGHGRSSNSSSTRTSTV